MLFGTDARSATGADPVLPRRLGRRAAHPRHLAARRRRTSPPPSSRRRRSRCKAGRGVDGVLDEAAALRPFWEQDAFVAVGCIGAHLETYAQHGRADEAEVYLDDAVRAFGEIVGDKWFLGRIRMCALALLGLRRRGDGRSRRASAGRWSSRAERIYADGVATAERCTGTGREHGLGIEARAWAARLDAEWARLLWLAGADGGAGGGRARRALAARGASASTTATRSSWRARGRDWPRSCARQGASPRRPSRPISPAPPPGRCGAEPLLAELRALASPTPTPVRRRPGSTALTDREREVLALLVDARTNRQIANQLYISEKTVSVHVSNILAKLDVRSRAEAAALARRRRGSAEHPPGDRVGHGVRRLVGQPVPRVLERDELVRRVDVVAGRLGRLPPEGQVRAAPQVRRRHAEPAAALRSRRATSRGTSSARP